MPTGRTPTSPSTGTADLFAVRASVKGATTKASVDEVLKEIAKLRQGGVEADELAQAKDLDGALLARRFETVLCRWRRSWR